MPCFQPVGGGRAGAEEGAPSWVSSIHPFRPILHPFYLLASRWAQVHGNHPVAEIRGHLCSRLSALPAGCPQAGCLPPSKVPSQSPLSCPGLVDLPHPITYPQPSSVQKKAPPIAGPACCARGRSTKFPIEGQIGSWSSTEVTGSPLQLLSSAFAPQKQSWVIYKRRGVAISMQLHFLNQAESWIWSWPNRVGGGQSSNIHTTSFLRTPTGSLSSSLLPRQPGLGPFPGWKGPKSMQVAGEGKNGGLVLLFGLPNILLPSLACSVLRGADH